MTRYLACVLVVAACTGKKPAGKCDNEVARLEAWIAILAAEGHTIYPSSRFLTPILVTEVAPATPPQLPVVQMTDREVRFQGRLLTTHDRIDELHVAELEELRAAMGKDATEIAVMADGSAPWRSIAVVGHAAAAAGFTRLRFVFRGVSKLPPPAPSWIDAELGPLHEVHDDNAPVPDLEAAMRRAKDPTRQRVFGRCPSGRAFLERSLADSGDETTDKSAVLLAGIAEAHRKCGCSEDVAAVQRWLWALWNREQSNMPHASVVVTLSAEAPRVELPAAMPWSDAHKTILAHARDNIAVRFGD
ncbi:MAG: hypothetical protein M4D80_01830 [Myxococcota bacterium]|nr:hypothetical protein [Myxococcota bacterium]